MFKALFKKELLENIQNLRFLLALILCLVVIPLGFTVSQKDYLDRRTAYDKVIHDYTETHKTVGDVMRNGGAAFRPPAALGLLAGGVEAVLPSAAETAGFITYQGAMVQFNNARRPDNPFASLFGHLDLAFIVSTVLAVLVMIFTFNAVAGEKERRTLAQVMANPVPRPLVVTAKMAAGSLLLAAAFLVGVTAGVLLTAALGIDPFREPGMWAPFGMAVGVSLLFLLTFYNFGLLVSSRSRSAVAAMVTVLSFWVVMAMILPKGSVVAAKMLLPVKSQQVVDLEKSQARDQISQELGAAIIHLTETTPVIKDMSTDEYFKARRAKNPAVEEFEKKQTELEDEFKAKTDAALERIDADFDQRKAREAALARNLARLSPVSCLVHVLTELAGTGFMEEAKWRETRTRFRQILDREIASRQQSVGFKDIWLTAFGRLDRKAPAPTVPAEPVPLEKRLAAVWVDLVLLGIYGLLFFVGAYVSFLGYDVR
ncbi:MAG: ABC transporter permease subunit [Candidatus Aminicenantales bacterium]|jgi:ABC-type transport system involved in multi-copper enzyme maturation permease subunit